MMMVYLRGKLGKYLTPIQFDAPEISPADIAKNAEFRENLRDQREVFTYSQIHQLTFNHPNSPTSRIH